MFSLERERADKAGRISELRKDGDPISDESADKLEQETLEPIREFISDPIGGYVFRLCRLARRVHSTGLWPWPGQLDKQDADLVGFVEYLAEYDKAMAQAQNSLLIGIIGALNGRKQ